MTTNTGHKHISQTPKGFVVTLPTDVSVRNNGTQTIQRKKLRDAVLARNRAFGFDPDNGVHPDFTPMHLPDLDLTRIRFGILADTHLCNKQEALVELHSFYQEAVQYGVRHFFLAGNWVDGDKIKCDIHTWGMDNQIAYFARNFPQIDGVQTFILDGDDHEGWWFQDTGIYPGEVLCNGQEKYGRDDLVYLGYMERDVNFKVGNRNVTLKVMHGGGGSAYAHSHASQKIIDKVFTPDEIPDILALGHYHKTDFLANYRGCYAFQPGAFCWQTRFMRKKTIASFVGGWVVDLSVGAKNRLRVAGHYLSYPSKPWRENPTPMNLTLART